MCCRYDFPHRLNATKVYPLPSPRGSQIIISAYDDGLHIIWRGGNPIRHPSHHGSLKEWNEPVSIHHIDEHSGKPKVTASASDDEKAVFEDQDDELEQDESCLPIIQELKLSLGSPVLHIAVPALPSQEASSLETWSFEQSVPVLMQVNVVVVAACADSSVRVITLPLSPPSAFAKRNYALDAQICHLAHTTSYHYNPRAVALSWTSTLTEDGEAATDGLPLSLQEQKYDLVVALSGSGVTDTLTFFRVPLTFDSLIGGLLPDEVGPSQTVQLAAPVNYIAFNPAPYPSDNHNRLLLADNKGSLKVYDIMASDSARSRPSSRQSNHVPSQASGAWIISFDTPFYLPKDSLSTYAGLAHRKSILDASWIMAGRAVFALLGDGEWGVWKVDGSGPGPTSQSNSMTKFAVGGTVLDDRTEGGDAPELKSRSNQRLAPMTPNTRKMRQESLFSGPSTTSVATVPRGGISVAATTTSHGIADDSIVFWYGSQVYHMASLASVMQGSHNKTRDLGSLYGPGLARLDNVNLSGEMLNDVVQAPARSSSTASVGSLTQRDIVVTGEYRLVVISTRRPQTPARSLFAREPGSPVISHDLQLLQKGELDLNGMGRVLQSMSGAENINGLGKAKRVGFVR